MISFIIEGRLMGLIFLIALAILLWYYTDKASKGKPETIRRLPAFDALDEAVGRAIEQGRPIMATYSFQDNFNPPTMVGLEAVRYTSKLAGEKGGTMLVGAGSARTLPVAMENYRLGCVEAGVPELYNPQNVYFFTRQQWAYASGVMGLMQREKPGACVFIGPFLVEGIHLGINSRRIETMAIAGNTSYSMGAFMFVSMDYVLLGEEMLAAGAYMTEDITNISGIAAEDVMKWVLAIILTAGTLLKIVGSDLIVKLLGV
jgi:hypothetical protein